MYKWAAVQMFVNKCFAEIPTQLVVTSVVSDWGGWRSYAVREDGAVEVKTDTDAELPKSRVCYYVSDRCLRPTMLDRIPEIAGLGFTVLVNDDFEETWMVIGTDTDLYEDNASMFEGLYDMLGFNWHEQ